MVVHGNRRKGGGVTLSPAESRIVALVALGHNDREIAARLELMEGSVKVCVCRVYRALGITKTWGNPRVRLVLWWLEKKASEAA